MRLDTLITISFSSNLYSTLNLLEILNSRFYQGSPILPSMNTAKFFILKIRIKWNRTKLYIYFLKFIFCDIFSKLCHYRPGQANLHYLCWQIVKISQPRSVLDKSILVLPPNYWPRSIGWSCSTLMHIKSSLNLTLQELLLYQTQTNVFLHPEKMSCNSLQ